MAYATALSYALVFGYIQFDVSHVEHVSYSYSLLALFFSGIYWLLYHIEVDTMYLYTSALFTIIAALVLP